MTEKNKDAPIVISADDARGAKEPARGNFGATLLPMLIGLIVLAVVGMSIVLYVVRV